MKNKSITTLFGLGAVLAAAGAVDAATVIVNSDITMSTTWTADNTYNMTQQVYVRDGATLTIEAGTVVASDQGSLAVARGSKLRVLGTRSEPVIFTSTADVATWDPDASHPTGGDPSTGNWRVAANEWGNITLMGKGLISASHFGGSPVIIDGTPNPKVPDGTAQKQMEGLEPALGDEDVARYGGADDDDDSGEIHYLSIRYGGKVIGLGNELNGLSLGAIGRETDIDHVEIMNNVDDGCEIWGGTVNLKNISIWNIGDDSFDVDEGWRGKAQFILIVQGYSLVASQGSGVGDNGFETDGAEDSDAQPQTTAVIYNATFVGQPTSGDGATTWRDNANVQYRNCVFMDCGEKVVRFDGDDGDGAQGYGFNGTLDWPTRWTTDSISHTYPVNSGANPFDPASIYGAQVDGKLIEISDSVFFNNADYNEANARGVFDPGNNNVNEPAAMPVRARSRSAAVLVGTLVMEPIASLDPRAANDATTSVGTAPNDGFFTPSQFRGAFSPTDNWICGWTAADAFGFVTTVCPADSNADGVVNVTDLVKVILDWNRTDYPASDVNCDGVVDVSDLVQTVLAWGACP